MNAYINGDETAFRSLYERYQPFLLGVMLRRRCPHAVAKELVQQSFLQLHRARHGFRPGTPLRPFLTTIAMNLLRQYYRTGARHRRLDALIPFEEAAEAIGTLGLEQSEQASRVRDAVRDLPRSQRIVVEMHWFDELPFAEVAHELGLSLSAVKVRAHRAYKQLRRQLHNAEAA